MTFTVPDQVPILTASNAMEDSVLLVWGPPLEANGVLTGYLLQYHLGMYTHNVLRQITDLPRSAHLRVSLGALAFQTSTSLCLTARCVIGGFVGAVGGGGGDQ